jgi:hypothetical protein
MIRILPADKKDGSMYPILTQIFNLQGAFKGRILLAEGLQNIMPN